LLLPRMDTKIALARLASGRAVPIGAECRCGVHDGPPGFVWKHAKRSMSGPPFVLQVSFTTVQCRATQKPPCERNRVIMGQDSPPKLGQRGSDAREEVPMKTPKRLYAQQRMIYQPELLTCPHCGDLLVLCNYCNCSTPRLVQPS